MSKWQRLALVFAYLGLATTAIAMILHLLREHREYAQYLATAGLISAMLAFIVKRLHK